MIRPSVLTLLLSLLLTLPASVQALTPFPNASVSEQTETQVSRYRLILSELTNRQGTISGDLERLLSGSLTRTVWELPAGVRLSEVVPQVRDQLQGQRILYQCQSIDCGSSNFWANDVFDNPRLVSRDREQAALVSLVRDGDMNRVTVVYVSLRGGRQPRVLVDELLTADAVSGNAVAEAEFEAALAHSSGWLPGLIDADGRLEMTALTQFNSALKSLSAGARSRLHLVVHCYRGTDLDETTACSDGVVGQLRPQLDAAIGLHSGGALTPAPVPSAQVAIRFIFWPGR